MNLIRRNPTITASVLDFAHDLEKLGGLSQLPMPNENDRTDYIPLRRIINKLPVEERECSHCGGRCKDQRKMVLSVDMWLTPEPLCESHGCLILECEGYSSPCWQRSSVYNSEILEANCYCEWQSCIAVHLLIQATLAISSAIMLVMPFPNAREFKEIAPLKLIDPQICSF